MVWSVSGDATESRLMAVRAKSRETQIAGGHFTSDEEKPKCPCGTRQAHAEPFLNRRVEPSQNRTKNYQIKASQKHPRGCYWTPFTFTS